jgi:uncharacterized protein (TIGR00369 family)
VSPIGVSYIRNVVTVEDINEFVTREYPGMPGNCEQVGDGWAVTLIDSSTVGLRPGGIISGPTIFGLCDAALWYACFTKIGIEPMALTSELSIRFLSPARGPFIRARADLVKVGRRSIVGNVAVWTDDASRPVAVAQGTYVPPAR